MNRKTLILTAVLAACTQSASASPQSQGQSATRLTAMAQRSLLRHCLYSAELVRNHMRFLYNLTEEQWAAAKDTITAVEQLRASIQVQVQGIDLELQMPTPDAKVLVRYGRKMQTLLEDWRKQHRKMAALTGIRL